MSSGNILAITYWSYKDALIQTYTLPYLRIIRKIIPGSHKVFLVTFESEEHPTPAEEKKIIKNELSLEGIHWIHLRYFPLSPRAFVNVAFSVTKLLALCLYQRIDFIHAWCTPAGSMGYLLSKITGASLIIDSYEAHAEAMIENGTWKKNSFIYKLLLRLEKWQSKHAKALIGTTAGMNEYALKTYGCVPEHFYVKPACVNLELFSDKNKKKEGLLKKMGFENKIVCVYAGKFGGIYLKKEVFDFFKVAHEYWKDKFRILLLTSHSPEEIQSYCIASGLEHNIITQLFVPHSEIPDYLGLGDFGITPVKPLPSKQYCSPIKDGEYWALGLPVVITPNISDDSRLITEYDAGTVVEAFDSLSCLNAVKKIDGILHSNSPSELYKKIRPMAEKYRNFTIAEKVYKGIYTDNI